LYTQKFLVECRYGIDCIMTKKEKKELALKLKFEIDAKKSKPQKKMISKEHMAQNNNRRQALQKAKSRQGDFFTGSRNKNKKPLQDNDPW